MQAAPPLGSWARAGNFVGLVARSDDRTVTLFDPGGRQQREVRVEEAQPVPAAAVEITLTVDLPLAHGLDETSLRRWLALLIDPVLRGRAAEVIAEAGLDAGAVLPRVALDAAARTDGQARCLCGAGTPTTPGVPVACDSCGRQAAPPIVPRDTGQLDVTAAG